MWYQIDYITTNNRAADTLSVAEYSALDAATAAGLNVIVTSQKRQGEHTHPHIYIHRYRDTIWTTPVVAWVLRERTAVPRERSTPLAVIMGLVRLLYSGRGVGPLAEVRSLSCNNAMVI